MAAPMSTSFRSHTCGELRATPVGERVTLAGWVHRRRDHGHLAFFDLRERPEGTANAELPTGEIEVAVDRVEVLNASKVPPFYINEEQPGLDESLRLEYRYLVLRRPSMQDRIGLRARLSAAL